MSHPWKSYIFNQFWGCDTVVDIKKKKKTYPWTTVLVMFFLFCIIFPSWNVCWKVQTFSCLCHVSHQQKKSVLLRGGGGGGEHSPACYYGGLNVIHRQKTNPVSKADRTASVFWIERVRKTQVELIYVVRSSNYLSSSVTWGKPPFC